MGIHPLTVFADHGAEGTGEPLAILLRAGQRRLQHRRRPHRGHPARPGAAAPPPAAPGADPHRLRRRHPRVPGLAHPAGPAAGLLGRVHHHRRHPGRHPARSPPARGPRPMTPTARSGPAPGSPSSPACWTWRLAEGDAGHRPQGTPAPRRPAAVHRHRRPPVHLLRHQHQGRAARRPGTTPPPPGPVRGPDPLRQGHRPAQPAPARLRPEPDLVRDRRAWPATCSPGCRCSP